MGHTGTGPVNSSNSPIRRWPESPRCEVCNGELSYCGDMTEDGPSLDCLLCQRRELVDFYRIRCEVLQKAQADFREPERTIVCNILANGKPKP